MMMGSIAPPVPLASPTTANTKLLLHMDGSNGGSTFTDSGPLSLPVARTGQTNTSTAQKVFGTASALFDGNDDYLGGMAGSNFTIGANQFSIFMWVRPTGVGNVCYCQRGWGSANRSFFFGTVGSGVLSFGWSNVGGTTQTGSISSASGLVQASQWQLVGVTRDASNTVRLFHALAGAASVPVVASKNDATTAQTFHNPSANFYIGILDDNTFDYGGNIDEALFTMECLATGEFVMPVAAFTVV
jgi:hypothetical protein